MNAINVISAVFDAGLAILVRIVAGAFLALGLIVALVVVVSAMRGRDDN